jgi:type IV secretion system protein VirD4
MHADNDPGPLIVIVVLVVVAAVVLTRRRWKRSGIGFGSATWTCERTLRRLKMLAGRGFVLGRTLKSGLLICLPTYTHLLLIGGSGSGKGVSCILVNLLYPDRRTRPGRPRSVLAFDVKGELRSITYQARRRAGRVYWFAPFDGGTDTINILDSIPIGPMLIDTARAVAEALATESHSEDPHWRERGVVILTAILVLVLLRFEGAERSLNAVADIAASPQMLLGAARQLQTMGGIPQRLGNQLQSLFDKEGEFTKEGAGVMATVSRYLSFLTSELVSKAVATSSFRVEDLLVPGTTLFIQIGANQLQACKGLLRCLIATFIRVIGERGSEAHEILLVLDEAEALSGLPALEEALVRGRSAGLRILLAYQSASQAQTAFRGKPSLLYDNCSTQIYLGGANSYDAAERISKSLGSYTQVLETFGESSSRGWKQGVTAPQQGGQDVNRGESFNLSEAGRPLLTPDEVLRLDRRLLIAFVDGLPILARRILWYSDPLFRSGWRLPSTGTVLWWLALAGAVGLIVWGVTLS